MLDSTCMQNLNQNLLYFSLHKKLILTVFQNLKMCIVQCIQILFFTETKYNEFRMISYNFLDFFKEHNTT
jgi:hypothetical protein